MKSYVYLFLSVTGLFATQLNAETVSVKTRSYVQSCLYYSSINADVDVTFEDESLKWGDKVFLQHALNGTQSRGGGQQTELTWAFPQEAEMKAKAPFTWNATVSRQLHARGSAYNFEQLAFVFKVVKADGEIYTLNGGKSAWGHYRVAARTKNTPPCVTRGEKLPEFKDVDVERFEQD